MKTSLAGTMKESLRGRTALVTGAGSGIGKATAKLLSYAGARVAVLGRSGDELAATVDEIGRHGEALPLLADVSDPAAMQAAFALLQKRWDRLDIVVANAGINGVWAPIEELAPEEWDRILDINLKGSFLTVKYAFPLLKRQGGSVVVVSSVNGTRTFGNTGATAYSCSKAGQIALVKMLAVEFGKFQVRVNAVCPGAVETKIDESTERRHLEEIRIPAEYPEGRIPLTGHRSGSAGEVAEAIWYLASDLSSHVTGTQIYVDGGQSLLQG